MSILRWYQDKAADKAIGFTRKCTDPFLVEIGTGGGKSHVIAKIASEFFKLSGKKVLVTAPTSEIITSNHEKFIDSGYEANIFCASLGVKQLKHNVTFGSPLSILNKIDRFEGYGLILIDEPRNVTKSIRKIIEVLAEKNGGSIRVGGFSATPYTTSSGYIYELDEHDKPMKEVDKPFFKKQVCNFGLSFLIKEGYNLPPVFVKGDDKYAHYDTRGLKRSSSKREEAAIFEGQERTTSRCMDDMVARTKDRHSVLIFAQTKQHAEECGSYLPNGSYEVITEKTKNRAEIIKRFEGFEFKYLINIAILGVGTNIPCVDAIAIVRYTESLDLLIQIIGRGTRKFNDTYRDGTSKQNFIVLDYTDNLTKHFPDGDFYNPRVNFKRKSEKREPIEVGCGDCGYTNSFSPRDNPAGLLVDNDGYFTNLMRERIMVDLPNGDSVGIPAHYGRRCENQTLINGVYARCSYRWSSKECPECEGENDIASKYCAHCKAEIIDPNNKLTLALKGLAGKFDPKTKKVKSISFRMEQTIRGEEYILLTAFCEDYDWLRFEVYSLDDNVLRIMKVPSFVVSLPAACKYMHDSKTRFSDITYKDKPRSKRCKELIAVTSR